jgi:histidine triad (HIT) family protein
MDAFCYNVPMFNHQPASYKCPFCELIAGKEDAYAGKNDVVYENDTVMAKIAPKWWMNNPGGVLVFPKEHYENIYDTPDHAVAEIYKVVKKIAVAVRSTYDQCEGTSTRQHNEPVGNQDVWHLHVHVFPRYRDDGLYINHENKAFVDAATRAPYAEKLRTFLYKAHV